MTSCPGPVQLVPDMSETFTKLFSSITRSSIWLEDDQTLRVWVTMLALADRSGYVGASVGGLAAMSRVDVEKTREALQKFLSPDPDSRSKEFEGRRIEVADRGWTLLNYDRFRDMRDEEARKEYERNRKKDQRAKKKRVPDSPEMSRTVPACPEMSAMSAQAEAEAAQRQKQISSATSQDQNHDRNETPTRERAPVDFMDCEDDLPCPLNLYDKAKERGVLSELGKAFGREAEWVESVAYEFCSHWTVGKGSGVRRKAWMGKLRKWVTDKHSKNEGPTPGSAHPKETNGERRPERALFKERAVKRAENGVELAREAIANLTRR